MTSKPHLVLLIVASVSCAHAQPSPAPAPTGAEVASPTGGPAAAGKLHGYLFRLKCGEAQDARSCKLSPEQERSRLDVVLAGDPAQIYDVRLRVRGLLEPRRYAGGALVDPAGNKWLYAGGAPDPSKKNGGHAYNVYQVAVSDPKQDHFLNHDSDDHLGGGYVPSHTIYKVDYVVPLRARGGAMVSVITNDKPGSGMINNADQQTVDGVPAAALPQPWDGQFFYLEVESVTPVAASAAGGKS
jgi:hypothetical protein